MQNLSLWQRFLQDTPKFERVVQVLALVFSLIVDHLAQAGYIPHNTILVLDGLLAGIAFIAQFAYEKDAVIKTIIADPGEALQMIPDLLDQFKALKEAIANPPVVTVATVEQTAAPLFQSPVIQQPVADAAPTQVFKTPIIQPTTDPSIQV